MMISMKTFLSVTIGINLFYLYLISSFYNYHRISLEEATFIGKLHSFQIGLRWRKIIAYSIFYPSSQNPKEKEIREWLNDAAINVVKENYIFFPEWISRFYVTPSVDKELIDQLLDLGAEIVHVEDWGESRNTFHRFVVADDPSVSRFLVRDLDSPASIRELMAVNDWISSKQPFHVIRDHPSHSIAILAGMWGAVGGYLPNITDLIFKNPTIMNDQLFLINHIWPLVKSETLQHDIDHSRHQCQSSFCRNIPSSARWENFYIGMPIRKTSKESVEFEVPSTSWLCWSTCSRQPLNCTCQTKFFENKSNSWEDIVIYTNGVTSKDKQTNIEGKHGFHYS